MPISCSDNDSEVEEDVARSKFSFDLKFEAPDVEKQVKLKLVDTDQEWKFVNDGFNYGGFCLNKQCKSNIEGDGFVCYNRGYGSIRPNEDIFYGVVRCKSCDQKFSPSEFIIKRAIGSLQYTIVGNNTLETVKICCIGNDNCEVFGQTYQDERWYCLMVFILKTPTVHVNVKQLKKEVVWSRKVIDAPETAIEVIHPKRIRFSQESIRRKFKCGRLISHTLWELKKCRITPYDIPIITVFRINNNWYTSDNRRLWVYQEMGKWDEDFEIPVKIIKSFKVLPKTITSENGGINVRLRKMDDSSC